MAPFKLDSKVLVAGDKIRNTDQARGPYEKHEEKSLPSDIKVHYLVVFCSKMLMGSQEVNDGSSVL